MWVHWEGAPSHPERGQPTTHSFPGTTQCTRCGSLRTSAAGQQVESCGKGGRNLSTCHHLHCRRPVSPVRAGRPANVPRPLTPPSAPKAAAYHPGCRLQQGTTPLPPHNTRHPNRCAPPHPAGELGGSAVPSTRTETPGPTPSGALSARTPSPYSRSRRPRQWVPLCSSPRGHPLPSSTVRPSTR